MVNEQPSFTDIEYGNRRQVSRREQFLDTIGATIPWQAWVAVIEPHYYQNRAGKRGRKPVPSETMLRMYLLQVWFSLSDEGVEEAIYDSYAMHRFMGLDFAVEQVPDATTLLHFRGHTPSSQACFAGRTLRVLTSRRPADGAAEQPVGHRGPSRGSSRRVADRPRWCAARRAHRPRAARPAGPTPCVLPLRLGRHSTASGLDDRSGRRRSPGADDAEAAFCRQAHAAGPRVPSSRCRYWRRAFIA